MVQSFFPLICTAEVPAEVSSDAFCFRFDSPAAVTVCWRFKSQTLSSIIQMAYAGVLKRRPDYSLYRNPIPSPTLMLSNHHTHLFQICLTTLFSHTRFEASSVSLTLIKQNLSFHHIIFLLQTSRLVKITVYCTLNAGTGLRKPLKRCGWMPHTPMRFPLQLISPHWTWRIYKMESTMTLYTEVVIRIHRQNRENRRRESNSWGKIGILVKRPTEKK